MEPSSLQTNHYPTLSFDSNASSNSLDNLSSEQKAYIQDLMTKTTQQTEDFYFQHFSEIKDDLKKIEINLKKEQSKSANKVNETLITTLLSRLNDFPTLSSDPQNPNKKRKLEEVSFVFTLPNAKTQKLGNDLPYDVNFLVEGQTILAHQSVLQLHSETFKTKYIQPITIPNCSATLFKAFVQFFYTEQVHLNSFNVFDFYNLATAYKVPKLKDLCASYITVSLSPKNAINYLYNINEWPNDPLHKVVFDYVLQNASSVFKKIEVISLPPESFLPLLESDFLNLPERKVFKIAVDWLNVQPIIDEELFKKVKSCIRFSQMSSSDLKWLLANKKVLGRSLLNDEEFEQTQTVKYAASIKPRVLS